MVYDVFQKIPEQYLRTPALELPRLSYEYSNTADLLDNIEYQISILLVNPFRKYNKADFLRRTAALFVLFAFKFFQLFLKRMFQYHDKKP